MSRDPRPAFKEVSLQFIALEIGMGFTFATVAVTESELGHLDRVREVRAKAETAYLEAERRLADARERGWEVNILRERLRDLRNRLEEIASEEPNVA